MNRAIISALFAVTLTLGCGGVSLILTLPVNAAASPKDDYDAGRIAYQKGDRKKSFQLLLKAARAGFEPAYGPLGKSYELGIGVPVDNTKAAVWYKKSAEAGRSYGQYFLAKAYLEGAGVAINFPLAMHFAKLALIETSDAQKILDAIKEKIGGNAYACIELGFNPSSNDYTVCAEQLARAQRDIQIQKEQYELQAQLYQQKLALYQAQQRAYEEERAEIAREKERRKWEALAAFGFGMAATNSPTLAGGLGDGFRALNGLPPLPPPAAPPAPSFQNYSIRLPNGALVYCSMLGGSVDCR
jgi:hypothetical protein